RVDWSAPSAAKAMCAAIPRDDRGSRARAATGSRATPRWTRGSPTHRSRIIAGSSFDDDRALHAERLMRQAIELIRARLRALEGDRVGIVGIRHWRAAGNGHELDALADLDSYRRWLERISRARADHLDGDRITGGAYGAHGWGW